ncbi:MAG: Na+/H+ antiporter NhaC family protein [Elainella sp.]
MDIGFALLVSFSLLVVSALQGVYIALPLLATLLILSLTLWRRGISGASLLQMAIQGSRKALPVFTILLMIGAVTSTWMAAGTVPALVYYGVGLINPHWFVLAAFLLTSLVSLLLGTSFGAAGTVGLALVIMARGSGSNPHLIAGAVIAGAYFGDRCSPMSSSAHLIAALTRTDLYANLKAMLTTGLLPFGLSSLIYWGWSWLYPVELTDSSLTQELRQFFDLNGIVLLPAVIILGLALLRVEVKRAMLVSIGTAMGLALLYQHYSWTQVMRFALLGFQLEADTPIQKILLGGGVWSMVKVCGIVLISTAIAGLLTGSRALQDLPLLRRGHLARNSSLTGRTRFLNTTLISLVAAGFGCTQTIGILLTEELVRPAYSQPADLALDLENSVVVLAPLVPWNIAGLVPATVLMTDWQFIPYAVYLYLIPAVVLLRSRCLSPKSQ